MSNHSAEIDARHSLWACLTEVGVATMAHTSGFAACADGSDSEETTCTRPSSLTSLRLNTDLEEVILAYSVFYSVF